jgi:hypothetical protein
VRNIACNTNKCCEEASTMVLIDVLKFAEALSNASSSSRLVLVSSPPHESSASTFTVQYFSEVCVKFPIWLFSVAP